MHISQTEVILRHAGTELARVTLPPGEYVVGRDAAAHIRADTLLLSRRHAQITIHQDHILVEDLGSANGTFINNQPVGAPRRVVPGQGIRLGPDIALEFCRLYTPPNSA